MLINHSCWALNIYRDEELNNIMNKCEVYIDGGIEKYEGQYDVTDNIVVVEIFNYAGMSMESIKIGSDVTYKEILVLDFSNKRYMYSPLFYNCGLLYGLVQSEKYRSDFYFESSNYKVIENFSCDMRFTEIKVYNEVLRYCFDNSALEITVNEDEMNYKIKRMPEAKTISIGTNNIKKIEINTSAKWTHKNDCYSVQIDTENYARLYLDECVDYHELIAYINELDVMIGSFMLAQIHSYETYIKTIDGVEFKLIHRHLSKDKGVKCPNRKPIKIQFEKYLENSYKKINYRNTNSRNEFILLDFKKPTSLEDEYTFYFRFIDLYMGKMLKSGTKNVSNYARLSEFVDKYISYFKEGEDYTDCDSLKNELNSLRNHFVHEGYYFPEDRFEVKGRKREFLYYKKIDYLWLYRIVKTFKLCSYLILYKEMLGYEIDENEFKNILK